MSWRLMNWPLALSIYLGLLAMFGVIVYCTDLPIRSMKVPADRMFHLRWLIVLWSLGFLVGFVLPTLTLFGVLPNWSITDPAITAPLLVGVVFTVYSPWMLRRTWASKGQNP